MRRGRASAVVVVVVILGRGVRGRSGSTAAHRHQGQAACGAGGARHDDNEEVGKCAMTGACNGGESRCSVRADIY